MENFKKTTKLNFSNMKKIFIFILIMFTVLNSVNAVIINFDQDKNLIDFQNNELGNVLVGTITPAVNTTLSVSSSNTTYVFDKKFEFESLNEDIYLILQNGYVNANITLMYRGDLTQNPTLFIQDLTLNEVGEYYFKVSPSTVNEPVVIYIDLPSDVVEPVTLIYKLVEEKPDSFNSIILKIIEPFVTIVEINITIWKIIFWTLILILAITLVVLIFYTAFYLFKKSRENMEH